MPENDERNIEILSALKALTVHSERGDNRFIQIEQLIQKTREEQIQKITELQIEIRALTDIKLSVQINRDKIEKIEDIVRENDTWIKSEITRREKRSDLISQNVSSITANGISQLLTVIVMLVILGWTVFREQYIHQIKENHQQIEQAPIEKRASPNE